jgi:HEAT repeat protein
MGLPRALVFAAIACVAAGFTARAQAPARAASLDEILKEIVAYDGGIESGALWKLRDYVQARKDDPAGRAECEPKLVAFLKTSATMVAKMAAGRALRVIASDQAVPALQALLADDRASDMALYALQQIPGAATDKALVQALSLPKVSGATKIAIVAALGERRSADAVPTLVGLLKQTDLAKAVATALGTIGNDAATQALVAAFAGAQGDLKPVVAASMMKCAEKSLAAKNDAAALRLYDTLAADASLPVPFRKAAAMGRITAGGSGAATILTGYLERSDEIMQEAALARLRDVIPPDAIAPVCARLPRLPESSQVKLLAVLAGYPKDRVLTAILDSARSNAAAVRIAAMKALASTGGPTEVPFLAQAAASARGTEQAAARTALGSLKGREVDAAILALMAQKPSEDVQAELLTAIADRRVYAAKGVIASALTSPSPRIRLSALKAIRAIGTPSDMPAALDLFAKSDDEVERTEAGKTTAALALKIASPDGRAGAIRARVTSEKDPQVRARYIGLLPLVGDNSTLPLLRRMLEASDADVVDAAVRALTAWPTSAAREDVLQLARDLRNETHRLLAITGLVRIIALDRYRDPEAAVADLRQAAGFSWRPEEQKLVLGALGQFPCRDALELATGFLREPTVAAEAEAAIKKLQAALKGKGR